MTENLDLNPSNALYNKEKENLYSELSDLNKDLERLKKELSKSPEGIEQELNRLFNRIKEIDDKFLEFFLKNISSTYYNKISIGLSETQGLKDAKVLYNGGIDVAFDSQYINIFPMHEIPNNFGKDIKLIQETINFLRGLVAFDNRNYFEVIRLLEGTTNPTFLNDYHYNQVLGLSYFYTKKYDLALGIFEKTKTNDKGELYALLMNKAAALRELGKLDEAKDVYEEILKKFPGDSTGLFAFAILNRVIGHDFVKKGNLDGAIKYYRDAVKLLSKSNNPQALQFAYKSYLNIGVVYYKLEQYDLASNMFNEISKDQTFLQYLSQKEIDTVIGGIYHSSRGNQSKLNNALELANKYSPGYVQYIKGVINGEYDYKGELVIDNDPIIIKH